MEDTIEICSGCGKMPRAIDHTTGQFICSRCGSRTTMYVTANDYEKVATELDQRFHQNMQKKKIEDAASAPVELPSPKKSRCMKTKKAAKSKPKTTARKKRKH